MLSLSGLRASIFFVFQHPDQVAAAWESLTDRAFQPLCNILDKMLHSAEGAGGLLVLP
jgi:hypothetical protein